MLINFKILVKRWKSSNKKWINGKMVLQKKLKIANKLRRFNLQFYQILKENIKDNKKMANQMVLEYYLAIVAMQK